MYERHILVIGSVAKSKTFGRGGFPKIQANPDSLRAVSNLDNYILRHLRNYQIPTDQESEEGIDAYQRLRG